MLLSEMFLGSNTECSPSPRTSFRTNTPCNVCHFTCPGNSIPILLLFMAKKFSGQFLVGFLVIYKARGKASLFHCVLMSTALKYSEGLEFRYRSRRSDAYLNCLQIDCITHIPSCKPRRDTHSWRGGEGETCDPVKVFPRSKIIRFD